VWGRNPRASCAVAGQGPLPPPPFFFFSQAAVSPPLIVLCPPPPPPPPPGRWVLFSRFPAPYFPAQDGGWFPPGWTPLSFPFGRNPAAGRGRAPL